MFSMSMRSAAATCRRFNLRASFTLASMERPISTILRCCSNATSMICYAPGEVCVICTGSQGEPLAELSKLSRGDARFLKVGADDTVILSSHPIPGNEWTVGRVIDDLHRAAAEVIHS